MSAVVDAIRAELVEVREDRAVRAKRLDVSHRSLLAARADFDMNQGRMSEANRRIDALVSALHLLGERDVEGSVEVPDDE